MKSDEYTHTDPTTEDQIDVIALIKTLWKDRKTILLFGGIFSIIGLFVAFSSPNVYTASTIMVPQGQSKSGSFGGLGGLAAMAGINFGEMGSSSQDLSPAVYPEIVKSYPFQKEIIHIPLKWNSFNEPISLYEYSKKNNKPNALSLIKKYTIGLPGIVRSLFTIGSGQIEEVDKVHDSLFSITASERVLCDALTNTLTLNVNLKNGYMVLSALGQEPLMTAQLAVNAQKLLQKKVTEFRIDKAKRNLAFIQERYNEKRLDFETSQDRLARFRDRNLYMSSNMAKNEEERLQSEYQLAFSVYAELAKQLETSKIKIKEETPVFSIIQPVSVPTIRTKPKKSQIVMIYIFIGGILGLLIIYIKTNWNGWSKNWKK